MNAEVGPGTWEGTGGPLIYAQTVMCTVPVIGKEGIKFGSCS